MDGWAPAEAERALDPSLPAIDATGFSSEAPRLGPQAVFLRKPYRPSAVLAAIAKLNAPRSPGLR